MCALRAYRPDLPAAAAEALLTSTASTGAAGRRLDAATAFRAAGLSRLVEAPAPPTSAPPATAPSAASPAPSVIVAPAAQAPSASDPLAELGVRRPRLRSSSYRRGILSVVVSGVPDFGRAIFTVEKRRYTRPSGKLRVRLKRAPRTMTVVVAVPDVGTTAPLRIRIKAAGKR